jgi:hypothetical protein
MKATSIPIPEKLRALAPHLNRTDAMLMYKASDDIERMERRILVLESLAKRQLAADLTRAKFDAECA